MSDAMLFMGLDDNGKNYQVQHRLPFVTCHAERECSGTIELIFTIKSFDLNNHIMCSAIKREKPRSV